MNPNDEHEGRADTIRAARVDGMRIADEQRRHWHRAHRNQPLTHLATITNKNNNNPPNVAQSQKHLTGTTSHTPKVAQEGL